jgi:hypothetical protein
VSGGEIILIIAFAACGAAGVEARAIPAGNAVLAVITLIGRIIGDARDLIRFANLHWPVAQLCGVAGHGG